MIGPIRSAFSSGRVKWRLHALQRMLERNIGRAEVARALASGELIETYPVGKPFPACLIAGLAGNRPIHAVIGWDAVAETAYVVTVYEPDLEHFEADFKTRRVKE
jgi:hypothetical protein